MRALFDEASVVEHDDAVCLLHSGQTVGDDEAGAIRAQVFQGLLDQSLGPVVQGGCGFI